MYIYINGCQHGRKPVTEMNGGKAHSGSWTRTLGKWQGATKVKMVSFFVVYNAWNGGVYNLLHYPVSRDLPWINMPRKKIDPIYPKHPLNKYIPVFLH